MDIISLLIKPASSLCNLRCTYCFYHDVSNRRLSKSFGIMNEETMMNLIEKAFLEAKKAVIFAFQGGEPTLAGLAYFEKFVELVSTFNQHHIQVNYAIQTNGTLLDDEFVMFFKKHNFLVGISIDGYETLHDIHRFDHQHKGTYQKVIEGVQLLKKYDVEFNVLTVVNKETVKYGTEIYEHYKKFDFKYIQFIPAIAPFGEDQNNHFLAVDSKSYGVFLDEVYKKWQDDVLHGEKISIRFFDNLVMMAMGFKAQACEQQGKCALNLVIESNGNVYPCDFYVLDQWLIGNINEHSFKDIINHEKTQLFIESSMKKTDQCLSCKYYPLCLGGCKRHRQKDIHTPIGMDQFCDAYTYFFDRNYENVFNLAQRFFIKNKI